MSAILNSIKNIVASNISVEVKAPIQRQGKTRIPVLVTDVSESFTKGWFLQYNPTPQENNTRLYDPAGTFSELRIANFSALKNLVDTANMYFLQGHSVETIQGGRRRAIYELGHVRLTAMSQPNSVRVTVTITDENSPFYMMSINFTVSSNDGQPYIIGSDKNWDRNTDSFVEYSANFTGRKVRYFRVHQEQNGPALLRAKIAVNNGMYGINQDGTIQVDTQASAGEIEYVQPVNNEFKALAYIYEQAIMEKAFEKAISQGLPTAQQAPNNYQAPQVPQMPNANGFTPAFNLGAPAPAPQNFAPQAPQNAGIPLSNQVPGAPNLNSVPANGFPTPPANNGGFPANAGFPAPQAPQQEQQQHHQQPQQPAMSGAPAGNATGNDLPWEN